MDCWEDADSCSFLRLVYFHTQGESVLIHSGENQRQKQNRLPGKITVPTAAQCGNGSDKTREEIGKVASHSSSDHHVKRSSFSLNYGQSADI